MCPGNGQCGLAYPGRSRKQDDPAAACGVHRQNVRVAPGERARRRQLTRRRYRVALRHGGGLMDVDVPVNLACLNRRPVDYPANLVRGNRGHIEIFFPSLVVWFSPFAACHAWYFQEIRNDVGKGKISDKYCHVKRKALYY